MAACPYSAIRLRNPENAVMDRNMLFLDGHYDSRGTNINGFLLC